MINSIIKECDPQVISDITENGIYFFGEASSVIGLDKFFQHHTSFKSSTSSTSMVGVGELIKYPQLLHKIIKKL